MTIFQAGDRREETTGVDRAGLHQRPAQADPHGAEEGLLRAGAPGARPGQRRRSRGINAAAEALKRENYVVDKLSLLATPKVPDDAAVLVIAGPRAPFLDPERQAVQEYLDRGGKVFLLLDPRQDTGLGDARLRLGGAGRRRPGDRSRGATTSATPRAILPLPQTGHRITASLPDLILPGPRSVTIKPGAGSEIVIVPLLRRPQTGPGRRRTSAARPPVRTRRTSKGPSRSPSRSTRRDADACIQPRRRRVAAGAAHARPGAAPKGRLVVVGDSDFASNTYLDQVIGQPRLLRQQRQLAGGGRGPDLRPRHARRRARPSCSATRPRCWSSTPRWCSSPWPCSCWAE